MTINIELTLTEEMLGTKAANAEVFASFIASKHPSGTPQRDELDQPENKEEAGTTVFHVEPPPPSVAPPLPGGEGRGEGEPSALALSNQPRRKGIYDYQIKGFFKDACSATNRFEKEDRQGLEKLPAFKSKIDGCIFVKPRFIPFVLPEGAVFGVCERPLRAETAQGPRVTVCRSESAPPGTILRFAVNILAKELIPYVNLWLDYGALRGLGQWRNSGKGRFSWIQFDDDNQPKKRAQS